MTTNSIICPHCNHEIELSQALSHQIKEQILATVATKHAAELEEAKKLSIEEAQKKAAAEFESQTKNLSIEIAEEKERNKKLTEKLDGLLEEMRALRRRDEERELEMKEKLLKEEERISLDARKKAEAEHELKDLEKNKKLADALKQIEDLKTKMQQGSQQMQGEVLELELERILHAEFPTDSISEVKKGERGADTVHTVVDKLGRTCGTILWETKNAQWQASWIAKLKEDQRAKKSELAVLVTINKPDWLESFTYKDGVWVTSWKFALPLAFALRYHLVSIKHEKASYEGREGKMEILYQYLTGTEFKHRVEAIVEGFGSMQKELEREKNWFHTKWAKQEKEMRKVLNNTHGMYGDLQGIIGASLPELPSGSINYTEPSNDPDIIK